MLEFLDRSTLETVVGLLWLVSFVLMLTVWRINRSVNGPLWWAAACAMYLLGFLSGSVGSRLFGYPMAYGAPLASGLSAFGMLFMLTGTLRFRARPTLSRAWVALPLLVAAIIFAQGGDPVVRYGLIDTAGFVLFTWCAWEMFGHSVDQERLVHGMVAAALLTLAAMMVGRAVTHLVFFERSPEIALAYQKVYLLAVVVFVVSWSYATTAACYVRANQALRSQAREDALTGLANRRLFEIALAQERERSLRSGASFGVCLIDLDDFKQINDTHGHEAGDALLMEVARRLNRGARRTDLPARLGGDEFAILLRGPVDQRGGEAAVARLRETLVGEANWNGVPLRIGASFGLALWPADGEMVRRLVQVADARMYQDKRARKAEGLGPVVMQAPVA